MGALGRAARWWESTLVSAWRPDEGSGWTAMNPEARRSDLSFGRTYAAWLMKVWSITSEF